MGKSSENEIKPKKVFPNEMLLQQAIAGLLDRLPNITNIQILQGSLEVGKDIVFNYVGSFGENLFGACVIKNTKISGNVAKSSGARTVFHQAEQAFDTPYIDESGKENIISRVYIISPVDISQSTILSIKGKLKKREGQIDFLCGAKLFDQFKLHWPDFIADEVNAVEGYLKSMQKDLESDNTLNTLTSIYRLGQIDAHYQKIYVKQKYYRDIRSYSLGSLLLISISGLENTWCKSDILILIKDLKMYSKSLLFLDEWGYISQDSTRSGYKWIEKYIPIICNELLEAWEEGVKDNTAIRINQISKISADVQIKLSYKPTLPQLIKKFNIESKNVLKLLNHTLSKINKIVKSKKIIEKNALSDNNFQTACALNNCAQFAPSGMFEFKQKNKDCVFRIKFESDLLNNYDNHLYFVGAPGIGKTSFCRWHALHDAELFNIGKSSIIPVFIPLHQLGRIHRNSIEELIIKRINISALFGGNSDIYISNPKFKIRLYLDGLDEISSVDQQNKIMNLIKEEVFKSSKYQVILTSRDYMSYSWLSWFTRISISLFDKKQINSLIHKWLGSKTSTVKQFRSQLNNSPSLNQMIQVPLLATLIILVFKQTGKLPENKTKLYEIFVTLLSGGWDIAKGLIRDSKYGERVKLTILTALARKVHESRLRFFDKKVLKSIIKSHAIGLYGDWETLKDELIIDGLISSSGNSLYFSHLSFQEFLTAKDYLGGPRPRRPLKELFLDDIWWKEVIQFYIGLTGKPREITNWILSEFERTQYSKHDDSLSTKNNSFQELLEGIENSYPEFQINEILSTYKRRNNSIASEKIGQK